MKSNQDTAQFDPIDAQRALELLEKAVAERGEEYVYQRVPHPGFEFGICAYVADGQASCMVGMALTLHGVPATLLEGNNSAPASALMYRGLEFIGADAGEVFRAAQVEQDAGESWGVALRAADGVASTFRVSS